MSRNDGGRSDPDRPPRTDSLAARQTIRPRRPQEAARHRLPVLDAYAVDPAAVAAFDEAAAVRASAVQSVAAAVRFAADAVRAAGGDDADVRLAVAATRRVLVHALAGAVAAELAELRGER